MRRVLSLVLIGLLTTTAYAQVSEQPNTPFKLATFETGGQERVGLLLDGRLLDIDAASAHLTREAGLPAVDMPADMLTLIEEYDELRGRLYQIANYLDGRAAGLPFAYDPTGVTIRAPIRYPSNLLAAALNYSEHATEMGSERSVDPDRDAPYMFAKSPRSSIADPGAPFEIPPGRTQIDWEGELAVVVGTAATRVDLNDAMDHVFGFTIMYDVSDREARPRENPAYSVDWFSAKSMDGAAPLGPYIVPKEFLPNYDRLRVTTRVNDRVVQDSDTSYLIYDVEHLLSYVTSIMTLYPGDIVATGTPPGVGAGRTPPEFVSPGDVVSIEIEGIGTLTTPIE